MLKALKWDLKDWNHRVFGNLYSHIESLREVVTTLDLRVKQGVISIEELEAKSTTSLDLWSLLWIKYFHIFQRSRAKWLKDVDANTICLHACVKSMSKRNVILTLKPMDDWVEGVSKICQVIVDHFSTQFREPYYDHPRLNGVSVYSFLEEDNASLTAHFL